MRSNKFHRFGKILNERSSIEFFFREMKHRPGLQHTPFDAHRPLGTAVQAEALIEHGMAR